MSMVSAHAQRWPARLFIASRRQLVGAGTHVVLSWMLRNMMITSSMRPLRANRDRKRPGMAGLCKIPAVPPAVRPHRAHAARLPWLMNDLIKPSVLRPDAIEITSQARAGPALIPACEA